MTHIYFLVLLLAIMASGQIVPYTRPPYMGPININSIYGPYRPYGPYGQYNPYGTYGPGEFYGGITSGPHRIYGPGGTHTSTYNSFYNQILERVNSYISPANAILAEAVRNFQICENANILASNIETYKSCMSTHVNKAFRDISLLESKTKQTCNTLGN